MAADPSGSIKDGLGRAIRLGGAVPSRLGDNLARALGLTVVLLIAIVLIPVVIAALVVAVLAAIVAWAYVSVRSFARRLREPNGALDGRSNVRVRVSPPPDDPSAAS